MEAAKIEQNVPEYTAAQAMDPEYWRSLAPEFTVEGNIDTHVLEVGSEQKETFMKKMDQEAYVHHIDAGFKLPYEKMRDLLAKIEEQGMPPVFAFAYDEFWAIHLQLRPFVKTFLGDEFAMLPDFWCWRVKPGEAGWKPHRDKTRGSLFPDGKPKSITVWVPLSIVRPLNSCMYILPADRDEYYYQDGPAAFGGSLPDVRALPADPGDVFAWTQRVFHWGSHSADEHNLPPRQSVAFEYQRSDVKAFNNPLLDPDQMPDFKARMALIAKQILQYTHMYEFTPELVKTAKTILDAFGLPEATGKSL